MGTAAPCSFLSSSDVFSRLEWQGCTSWWGRAAPPAGPLLCLVSGWAVLGGLSAQSRGSRLGAWGGHVGRQTRVAACPPPSGKRRGAAPEVRRGLIRSENALIVNRSAWLPWRELPPSGVLPSWLRSPPQLHWPGQHE